MNTLPNPTGHELIALNQSGVMADLVKTYATFTRTLRDVNPLGILALAMARNPDMPTETAVQQLKTDVTELASFMAVAGEALQETRAKEEQRRAPLVAAAGHRVLEIVGVLQYLPARIRNGEDHVAQKRKKLINSGLTQAELASVTQDFDPAPLLAEQAALQTEQRQLEQFLATRDPAHLPSGFADSLPEAA